MNKHTYQKFPTDKISAADKYRQAHSALIALGLPEDDLTLKPLSDDQLWMTNISQPMQLGDSKREDPWFWSVGCPCGLSKAEEKDWSIESMSFLSLPCPRLTRT